MTRRTLGDIRNLDLRLLIRQMSVIRVLKIEHFRIRNLDLRLLIRQMSVIRVVKIEYFGKVNLRTCD